MTPPLRLISIAVVVTALAAGIGGAVGVRYGIAHSASQPEIHNLLHHELDLTPEQDHQIEVLESAFETRRKALEVDIHTANQALAAAIVADHAYGPRAEQSINDFHHALSDLQVATVKHILDMRAVLTPAQAERFDQTVTKALGTEQP